MKNLLKVILHVFNAESLPAFETRPTTPFQEITSISVNDDVHFTEVLYNRKAS